MEHTYLLTDGRTGGQDRGLMQHYRTAAYNGGFCGFCVYVHGLYTQRALPSQLVKYVL